MVAKVPLISKNFKDSFVFPNKHTFSFVDLYWRTGSKAMNCMHNLINNFSCAGTVEDFTKSTFADMHSVKMKQKNSPKNLHGLVFCFMFLLVLPMSEIMLLNFY